MKNILFFSVLCTFASAMELRASYDGVDRGVARWLGDNEDVAPLWKAVREKPRGLRGLFYAKQKAQARDALIAALEKKIKEADRKAGVSPDAQPGSALERNENYAKWNMDTLAPRIARWAARRGVETEAEMGSAVTALNNGAGGAGLDQWLGHAKADLDWTAPKYMRSKRWHPWITAGYTTSGVIGLLAVALFVATLMAKKSLKKGDKEAQASKALAMLKKYGFPATALCAAVALATGLVAADAHLKAPLWATGGDNMGRWYPSWDAPRAGNPKVDPVW